MGDPFDLDRYKQRQTQSDRDQIARDTKRFLESGGKIKKLSSVFSSGVCDLPPKEIRDIKKKLGVLPKGGDKC
jgi:hypothetical protein